MAKKMFEAFQIMNESDRKNNTATLGVCNSFVSADLCKGGGKIAMGVPEKVILDMLHDQCDYIPILLLVNKKEYDKIINS